MTTGHLLAFPLVAAALAAIPGPSVLFVISRSLVLGRAAGPATALGDNLGKVVQVVVVAFGAGLLLQQSILAFTVVKLAGAAYLVVLGVQAIRHRRALHGTLDARVEPRTVRRPLADTGVVGASSPKGAVILTAVLPQFIDRPADHVPLQLLTPGAVFVALTLAAHPLRALGAGAARWWLARWPRRLEAAGGAGGLTLIGLGVGLAVSGRRERRCPPRPSAAPRPRGALARLGARRGRQGRPRRPPNPAPPSGRPRRPQTSTRPGPGPRGAARPRPPPRRGPRPRGPRPAAAPAARRPGRWPRPRG